MLKFGSIPSSCIYWIRVETITNNIHEWLCPEYGETISSSTEEILRFNKALPVDYKVDSKPQNQRQPEKSTKPDFRQIINSLKLPISL